HSAEMNLIKNHDVLESLAHYAREHRAAYIITGQSPGSIKDDESLTWRLHAILPHAQIRAVAAQ
ncbi:MAG: hypothetical protein PHO66_08915, partial [Eubacteriales bacterium]|nr:hypothetical protein [Eubacteriales bacterium]